MGYGELFGCGVLWAWWNRRTGSVKGTEAVVAGAGGWGLGLGAGGWGLRREGEVGVE